MAEMIESDCTNPECGICHVCRGNHLTSECTARPDPKLAARLEAAEKMAGALRRLLGREGAQETLLIEALAAWEASAPARESK